MLLQKWMNNLNSHWTKGEIGYQLSVICAVEFGNAENLAQFPVSPEDIRFEHGHTENVFIQGPLGENHSHSISIVVAHPYNNC